MRHFWLFVILAFALQSCSHKDGARPEIKKDKLVDVLVDIHIVDGYLAYTGSRIERDRDRIEGAYGFVLQKYDITPRQFHNTMIYYSRHMEDYEQLYNKVIEKLTLIEADAMKDGDGSPKRADTPSAPVRPHRKKAQESRE